jgi:hypothetical protein
MVAVKGDACKNSPKVKGLGRETLSNIDVQ